MYKQQGFSLLEIVVAFTIIAVVTTLSVNVVAQNASRIHRMEQHVQLMNAAESAVAMLRMQLGNEKGRARPVYKGKLDNRFSWQAMVSNANETASANRVISLYKVGVEIYQKGKKEPVYQLATMLVGK